MNLILIDGLAGPWLEALVRACWQGGLALGLVWVVCRLWPRISPRAQCWLWRLAYVKLVMAFLLPASIDLPLLPAPLLVTSQRQLAESPMPELLVQRDGVTVALAPSSRLSVAGWLLLAWTIVVSAHLVRVWWGWRLTRALRRRCRPVDDPYLEQCCAETGQRLGLRQRVKIVTAHDVPRPLLLGPLHPMIVLPALLLGRSTPAQIRMLLAHELAHWQRRDLWWGWLLVLGEGLFFFHPLVWLSRVEWRLSQEMACDALAVWAAKSPRREYGTLLLDLSASGSGAFAPARSITVSIMETKRNLERRLKAMQFIGQEASRELRIATACLVGAATLGVLPWRVVAESPLSDTQAQGSQKSGEEQADRGSVSRTGPQYPERRVNRAAASEKGKRASEGQVVKVFALEYADAEDLANHLLALIRGRRDPGASQKVTVVADRRTNAMIVQAPEDEMLSITKLIQALDQAGVEKGQTTEGRAEGGESTRPIAIVPPRPGFVQKVLVSSGKAVKKGDPLVELDDQQARNKVKYALAQLEIAKASLAIQESQAKGVRRQYEQLRALRDKNVVASEELETKKTAYEVEEARIAKAQAELQLAQEQVEQNKMDLSLLTIRAPIEGTVKRVRVQVGEYVSATPAQPLMVISR